MSNACQCASCRPHAPGKTYTRAFMRECEARAVLAMPFADRKPYLKKIEERRGENARRVLENEVMRLWR